MEELMPPPYGHGSLDSLVRWLGSKKRIKRGMAAGALCRVGRSVIDFLVAEVTKPGKTPEHRAVWTTSALWRKAFWSAVDVPSSPSTPEGYREPDAGRHALYGGGFSLLYQAIIVLPRRPVDPSNMEAASRL